MDEDLQPQIEKIPNPDADGVLITSDGAHTLTKDAWDTICLHSKNGSDLVRKLLNVADAFGGLDNATALFLPARLTETPSPDDGPGMTITLLSLSAESEIWIPNGSDQDARQNGHRSAEAQMPPPTVEKEPQIAKKGPSKRKRPAKPKRDRSAADMLPLEDSVETAKLDFPDDVEG
jgi:hypothetical protein